MGIDGGNDTGRAAGFAVLGGRGGIPLTGLAALPASANVGVAELAVVPAG